MHKHFEERGGGREGGGRKGGQVHGHTEKPGSGRRGGGRGFGRNTVNTYAGEINSEAKLDCGRRHRGQKVQYLHFEERGDCQIWI